MENTLTVINQDEIKSRLSELIKEDLSHYDVIDNKPDLRSSKKYDVSYVFTMIYQLFRVKPACAS